MRAQSTLRRRVNAFIVDLLLISMIRSICLYSYLSFMGKYFSAPVVDYDFFSNLFILGNFLTIVIFMGYFICCYYMGNGKTLGKLLFKLRVQSSKTNDSNLSLNECFLRSLGYLFCYLNFFILFLVVFVTKDEKGIPDWISSTMVVDANKIPVEYEENEAFNLKGAA